MDETQDSSTKTLVARASKYVVVIKDTSCSDSQARFRQVEFFSKAFCVTNLQASTLATYHPQHTASCIHPMSAYLAHYSKVAQSGCAELQYMLMVGGATNIEPMEAVHENILEIGVKSTYITLSVRVIILVHK